MERVGPADKKKKFPVFCYFHVGYLHRPVHFDFVLAFFGLFIFEVVSLRYTRVSDVSVFELVI